MLVVDINNANQLLVEPHAECFRSYLSGESSSSKYSTQEVSGSFEELGILEAIFNPISERLNLQSEESETLELEIYFPTDQE